MNGTWTTKPPPKILQTTLGSLLIAVILIVGLLYQSGYLTAPRITFHAAGTPSQSPTPTAATPRASTGPAHGDVVMRRQPEIQYRS